MLVDLDPDLLMEMPTYTIPVQGDCAVEFGSEMLGALSKESRERINDPKANAGIRVNIAAAAID